MINKETNRRPMVPEDLHPNALLRMLGAKRKVLKERLQDFVRFHRVKIQTSQMKSPAIRQFTLFDREGKDDEICIVSYYEESVRYLPLAFTLDCMALDLKLDDDAEDFVSRLSDDVRPHLREWISFLEKDIETFLRYMADPSKLMNKLKQEINQLLGDELEIEFSARTGEDRRLFVDFQPKGTKRHFCLVSRFYLGKAEVFKADQKRTTDELIDFKDNIEAIMKIVEQYKWYFMDFNC